MGHAIFSPSSAKRWLNCPGSIALCETLPEPPESRYAAEGTDAHKCLELMLKHSDKSLAVKDYCAKQYGIEKANHAYDALWAIRKFVTPGAEIFAERKVYLTHIDPEFYGTADCTIVDYFGTLTIADYKYGQGIPVDVEENEQLLAYALAAAHELHYNFSEVKLVIIQPRAPHKDGPIRQWSLSIDALKEWEGIFKRGIEACKKENAAISSGPWCRFCIGKTECFAFDESNLEKISFSSRNVVDNFTALD